MTTNTTGRFRVRLLRARSEAEERRIRRFVLEALRLVGEERAEDAADHRLGRRVAPANVRPV